MRYAQCEREGCTDPLRRRYMVLVEAKDSEPRHYCSERCAFDFIE